MVNKKVTHEVWSHSLKINMRVDTNSGALHILTPMRKHSPRKRHGTTKYEYAWFT